MRKETKQATILPKLNFNDPEETVTIDLGGGNWIEVSAAQSEASQNAYMAVYSGLTHVGASMAAIGVDIELSPWVVDVARVQSRVVNWHIELKRRDGSSREVPFDASKTDKLPSDIVKYASKQIQELDANFAENVTGTADPLA
jgi:hypothetical protein